MTDRTEFSFKPTLKKTRYKNDFLRIKTIQKKIYDFLPEDNF